MGSCDTRPWSCSLSCSRGGKTAAQCIDGTGARRYGDSVRSCRRKLSELPSSPCPPQLHKPEGQACGRFEACIDRVAGGGGISGSDRLWQCCQSVACPGL